MHDFVEWAARFTWKLAASTCFDNLPSLPLSFILLFLPEIVRLSVIWKNLVILLRYFISIFLSLPLLPRQLIEELGEFLKKLRDAKTSNHEILRINKRNGDGTEEERFMDSVFSFPEKRFWPESLRAKVKLSRVELASLIVLFQRET